jgi:Zn finger protein HypA/HybF involved in hydrogenase expression
MSKQITPNELAHELIGTCSNIDPEEELGSDMATLLEFDSLAFRCESCEWWCSMDEAYESSSGHDFLCEQCKDENDEDEF